MGMNREERLAAVLAEGRVARAGWVVQVASRAAAVATAVVALVAMEAAYIPRGVVRTVPSRSCVGGTNSSRCCRYIRRLLLYQTEPHRTFGACQAGTCPSRHGSCSN